MLSRVLGRCRGHGGLERGSLAALSSASLSSVSSAAPVGGRGGRNRRAPDVVRRAREEKRKMNGRGRRHKGGSQPWLKQERRERERREPVAVQPIVSEGGERIGKVLAFQGVCSRRLGEQLVREGLVEVNGKKVEELGTKVHPFASQVAISGRPVKLMYSKPEEWSPKIWLHHKLRHVLVTHDGAQQEEEMRMTLFGSLRKMLFPQYEQASKAIADSYHFQQRLKKATGASKVAMYETEVLRRLNYQAGTHIISVGRLDFTSEGLLVVTNDGELARHLELPANKYRRRYEVSVHGNVTESKLKALRHGIKVEGVLYQPIEISVVKQRRTNAVVDVVLEEGKNRELRKMFAHMGWQVSMLKRLEYGPFKLEKLPKGSLMAVPAKGSVEQWIKAQRKALVEAYGEKEGEKEEKEGKEAQEAGEGVEKEEKASADV